MYSITACIALPAWGGESSCLVWLQGRTALCRGSPASCRMMCSLEPVGSWTGMQQDAQGVLWLSPEPGAVITHSTGTLWDPAAAPALASPWHPERQYLLPGAELCSTVQKMGSCLPLLRTQLKSCSCKKPVFSKHWGSAFNCWLWF